MKCHGPEALLRYIAQNIEADVRAVWLEVLMAGLYKGEARKQVAEGVAASVHSSYLGQGAARGGWTCPDPTVVLVSSEGGVISDPYRSERWQSDWNTVVVMLERRGKYSSAAWESINSAVHSIMVEPLIAS